MNLVNIRTWIIVCVLFSAAGCSREEQIEEPAQAEITTQEEVAAPQPADVDWLSYGNGYNEQRFSSLDQINAENVGRLGLDWALDIPDAIQFVSTPLAIDGVLYFSGDRAIIRAVDAASGELLWTYDPKVGAKQSAGDCSRVEH